MRASAQTTRSSTHSAAARDAAIDNDAEQASSAAVHGTADAGSADAAQRDTEKEGKEATGDDNDDDDGDDDDDASIEYLDGDEAAAAEAAAAAAKARGNAAFGARELEAAAAAYGEALTALARVRGATELRAACLGNRAACHLALGALDACVSDCDAALDIDDAYVKVLLRRSTAHERLEHFALAEADAQRVVELDPTNDAARRAVTRLAPRAAAERERQKEEMLGKLKDLGNR